MKEQRNNNEVFYRGSRVVAVIFFVLFSFFSINSAAAVEKNDALDENLRGVAPSGPEEWKYHGISMEEAREWIDAGIIFAGWAAQWKGEGISAKDAKKWHKLVNVYTAADFVKNGFGPDEAKLWMDKGIRSGKRAGEYRNLGMSAEVAGQFWKNSIYPEDAGEWWKAGFNAEETIAWRYGPIESAFYFTKDSPYGRSVYKLDAAVWWRQAGFTADELHRADAYGIGFEEAIDWKKAGFTLSEHAAWKDSGFTLDQALEKKAAGVDAYEAELKLFDAKKEKVDEITKLEIEIYVKKDASLAVTETIEFVNRTKGAYEYGFVKMLPARSELRASSYSGVTYSNPTFKIKSVELDNVKTDYIIDRDSLKIGTKEKPLVEGEHRIKLSYETDGRIMFLKHYDEIYFEIKKENFYTVGGLSELPYVRRAEVTVHLPKGADVIYTTGHAGLRGRSDYSVEVGESGGGDAVKFIMQRPLREEMSFGVNAAFVKGVVKESLWHKIRQLDKKAGRFLTSAVIFIGGGFVVFLYYLVVWYKVGRDPKVKENENKELKAPDDVDPTLARAYALNGKADYISAASWLLYAAEKEFISISEKKGVYLFKKTAGKNVASWKPNNKVFYDVFFGGKEDVVVKTAETSIELKNLFHAIKAFVKQECGRLSVSNARYLWPGIVVSIAAIISSLYVLDFDDHDDEVVYFIYAYGVFMSAVFSGLMFSFKKFLKYPAPELVRMQGRLKNYSMFLKSNLERSTKSGFISPFLREHLAYAMALGLDVKKAMVRSIDAKWYYGNSGAFSCGDFLKLVKKKI